MNLSTETATKGNPMETAASVRKFMFDQSFDDATVVHRAAERKPVLMKPDQIDALKKEGYDQGFAAGKDAGHAEQTAALTALLSVIEKNIDRLIQHMDALAQDQDTHTRSLVLAIAKKIMPDFMARNGLQEIEALLNDTLRDMSREPRLVVRIHESLFDAVDEKIQTIAAQRAYSGKVIVLADATVASGDCRIEWTDGGIERNTQATWNAIEQTINPTT